MVVDIGKLRHRIGIFKKGSIIDDKLITRETLVKISDFWCSVKSYKSEDHFNDKEYIKKNKIVFYIRFTNKVEINNIVEFKGVSYNITKIEDLGFEHKLLMLDCEEI